MLRRFKQAEMNEMLKLMSNQIQGNELNETGSGQDTVNGKQDTVNKIEISGFIKGKEFTEQVHNYHLHRDST